MRLIGNVVAAALGVAAVLALWIALARVDMLSMRDDTLEGFGRVVSLERERHMLAEPLVDAAQKAGLAGAVVSGVAAARAKAESVKPDEALIEDVENFKRYDRYQTAYGQAVQALAQAAAAVPELKAQKPFQELAADVESLEARIGSERDNYNEFALQYNERLAGFPGERVARRERLAPRPYLTSPTPKK